MRSKFWAFVEACDETQTPRAAKDLLSTAVRSLGFDRYVLLTHAPSHVLGNLSVLAHNLNAEALEHLLGESGGGPNPLFDAVERTPGLLYWWSKPWRSSLKKDQRVWLDRLRKLTGGDGVSAAMRSRVVSASCSLTTSDVFHPDTVRVCMRIANYAFYHIQYLQRPDLSEADRLTAREQECLYRAAVYGEKPSAVARSLGVKVSTVRTLRQKANGRLDADSPEQAVWRMIQTGQLFRSGRKSKPRTW